MNSFDPQASTNPIEGRRRKGISLTQEGVVKIQPLKVNGDLPLLIQPATDGVDLLTWAGKSRELIETQLLKHAGILFRGFKVEDLARFEQLITTVSGTSLEYTYRSTPRQQVSGKIYTSTEYPSDQFIPLHNEMSYSRSWPGKIWFFCVKAAEHGGETPIADSRKVFQGIDARIRDLFMSRQIMYVRNYGSGLDLQWEEVFQTKSRSEVEVYCKKSGIEFEWIGESRLRTREVCQAVTRHTKTGEYVWFNQAHLFHISSLPKAVSETLLAEFNEEDLPRNAYFGDGSAIDTAMLDEIRDVYQRESILFPWQEGDLLMLDNVLAAHGRTPFSGARKIVVGMAEQTGVAGTQASTSI